MDEVKVGQIWRLKDDKHSDHFYRITKIYKEVFYCDCCSEENFLEIVKGDQKISWLQSYCELFKNTKEYEITQRYVSRLSKIE